LAGMSKTSLAWFAGTLLAIGLIAGVSPTERTLGSGVRIVYLHGAWVWAALLVFCAAAITGGAGLLTHRQDLHQWSRALGRTGLVFWVSYLPISLWAMQANWNGLFLAEPRWRLAVIFAIGGLVLQLGLSLLETPAWASAANIVFLAVLTLALSNTRNVMHPPAPILNSSAIRIQIYFFGLVCLTLLAAWQVAVWWHALEHADAGSFRAKNRRMS
jgi:hypothetical protein